MSDNTYKRFTREQILSINDISIIGDIKSKGYKLTPLSKNEFKIKGYGGLVQLLIFLDSISWKERTG